MLVVLLLIISSYGCAQEDPEPQQDNTTQDNEITENVKLFYGDENNEKMIIEEKEVTFTKTDDKYKVVLEELIKGPKDENLTANIPKQTKVYGTVRQNEALVVNISKEFKSFGGALAEIIAVGSIVNTMTKFDDIERVKILVEGEELIGPSGNPRGFMDEFPTDPSITDSEDTNSQEVILYFGNKDADAVVAERRNISIQPDMSTENIIKQVLAELIQGPVNEDISRTIPDEVEVLSVNIENGIAYVDFSEEMHTNHWGGAAGESMTINSIVNTLTEFENIDKVKITVEGEPLAIEHMIIDEPIERDESMIAE